MRKVRGIELGHPATSFATVSHAEQNCHHPGRRSWASPSTARRCSTATPPALRHLRQDESAQRGQIKKGRLYDQGYPDRIRCPEAQGGRRSSLGTLRNRNPAAPSRNHKSWIARGLAPARSGRQYKASPHYEFSGAFVPTCAGGPGGGAPAFPSPPATGLADLHPHALRRGRNSR
jgi:hypothetical protein